MLNYTYLAEQADIEAFGPNQLADYKYIALVGLGKQAKSMSTVEFELIRSSLAHFMKDSCYLVHQSDLEKLPNDCFIRSIYSIFEPHTGNGDYIAISTVLRHVNHRIHLKPAYHSIVASDSSSTRYPYYEAINNCLDRLKDDLQITTLEDYPLPNLQPKEKGLLTPKSWLLASLRKKIGSQDDVSGTDISVMIGDKTITDKLSKTTIIKAENYGSLTNRSLMLLAAQHQVSVESIRLNRVVPDTNRIRKAIQSTGLNLQEFANELELESTLFLDLLLDSRVIPTSALRFFHQRLKGVTGEQNLRISDFINRPATQNLV